MLGHIPLPLVILVAARRKNGVGSKALCLSPLTNVEWHCKLLKQCCRIASVLVGGSRLDLLSR